MLENSPVAKYNKETVQAIPDTDIAKELLIAQQENIAKANADVQLILDEITRRLLLINSLTQEIATLKLQKSSKEEYPGESGNY